MASPLRQLSPHEESTPGSVPSTRRPALIDPTTRLGTDGFEFVEFAHPSPKQLSRAVRNDGTRRRPGPHQACHVYRQGDINYLLNASRTRRASSRTRPCAPAMAFRVVDARQAYDRRSPSAGTDTGSRQRSTFRRSSGIGGRCSISSIATAPRARPTTSSSTGPANAIPARRARFLLPRPPDPQRHRGAWTLVRFYVARSTSARSASSTSKAS